MISYLSILPFLPEPLICNNCTFLYFANILTTGEAKIS